MKNCQFLFFILAIVNYIDAVLTDVTIALFRPMKIGWKHAGMHLPLNKKCTCKKTNKSL